LWPSNGEVFLGDAASLGPRQQRETATASGLLLLPSEGGPGLVAKGGVKREASLLFEALLLCQRQSLLRDAAAKHHDSCSKPM
jgi:hypothetical protein